MTYDDAIEQMQRYATVVCHDQSEQDTVKALTLLASRLSDRRNEDECALLILIGGILCWVW
ncbi:hypothetical protein [Glaciimonas soli]|uniref:Uncharacterized protein n=1 Tax=Glaciimonas soli TaxID=2590999 RepID=A0A843YY25_9BURK|nr:hypothetical protein [Glaciimonas soli]MQR02564.1 hypothetical protein [Glaciimonas soli]